jgi:hypothetical protein
MTDFKVTTWMSEWTADDHDEYEAAWTKATASDIDQDSGRCSRKWLELILAAADDNKQWATDVLADMQRRGALESWKSATVKPVVTRKGKTLTAVAAAKRRDSSGQRDVHVQTELFDMPRQELEMQVAANQEQSKTYAAKSALAKRLLELVDQAVAAGAPADCTPRQAAKWLKIDLTLWAAS